MEAAHAAALLRDMRAMERTAALIEAEKEVEKKSKGGARPVETTSWTGLLAMRRLLLRPEAFPERQ